MSEKGVLTPNIGWLDGKLRELRIKKPNWEGPILNRFQAEMTLYNVSSQSALQLAIGESVKSQERLTEVQIEQADRLQETLERSIKSQDKLAEVQNKLSRNANFLAWGAFIFAAVQILVAVFIRG